MLSTTLYYQSLTDPLTREKESCVVPCTSTCKAASSIDDRVQLRQDVTRLLKLSAMYPLRSVVPADQAMLANAYSTVAPIDTQQSYREGEETNTAVVLILRRMYSPVYTMS